MKGRELALRRRQLGALTGPLGHALRWEIPAVTVATTCAFVLWQREMLEAPASAVWLVRGVGLLLALGSLPLLDDAGALQVAAVPMSLAWRAGARLVAAAMLVAVPVGVLAGVAGLPVPSLLVEVGAVLTLSATASVVMTQRRQHREPSSPLSLGLVPLPAVLLALPPSVALLVPLGPRWTGAHQRWGVLLVTGTAVLALALRDPATRRWTSALMR